MTAMTQKAYKGMGMEGSIARWYEKTTSKDIRDFQELARRIAELVPTGGKILEVAPGPGFLAVELARTGRFSMTGVDISRTFVEIARQKAEATGVSVEFLQGNAAKLPLPRNSFDFLVCRAAFKNFSEPVKAIAEMHRVLKPGGKALIIDLRRDVPRSEVNSYVDNLGVGAISRWMTKLTFRFMLIKRAYTSDEFHRMAAQTPFGKCDLRSAPLGFEVWLEKSQFAD
jgi:ubiquinone/menaquinone biosynthesis C-methylase UbiE